MSYSSAGALALAEQAKAEALARYQIALARPRDMDVVRQRLLQECRRVSLAEDAEYEIPRGGSKVRGPSIRLAEAVQRALGNIRATTQVVHETADARTVRVVVEDVEANSSHSGEIVVRLTQERRSLRKGQEAIGTRVASDGRTVYLVEVSEAEQYQAQQSGVSRLLRTLILRHAPAGLVSEALDVCRQTLRAQDTAAPEQQRQRLADAFASIGVGADHLSEYLGHPLAQCSPAQMERLRGVYAAIRDGSTTWSDVTAEDSEEVAPEPQPRSTKAHAVRERIRASKAGCEAVPKEFQPRVGAVGNGIRWHEWQLSGDLWHGEWSDDEGETGSVVCSRDGRILDGDSDGLHEAVAWAWGAQ